MGDGPRVTGDAGHVEARRGPVVDSTGKRSPRKRVASTSTKKGIVVRMATDPEPLDSLGNRDTQSPIAAADADAAIGPVLNAFELKRGMRRVLLQQFIVTECCFLEIIGQSVEALPEPF